MPIALNMIMKKIVVFLIQNIFGKHLNDDDDDDDDDDLYFIQFVDFVDFV
jgi:hypothetical protein